jgi:sugar phosphate isomerase/epimerase
MLLSYNTNGLRTMSLLDAIAQVSRAGYSGIELSLHQSHLYPPRISDYQLQEIKDRLNSAGIVPACLATGAADLLSGVPYEPSLISIDPKGRQQRIDLIISAISIARHLSIPVVNFASGILREGMSASAADKHLLDGIEKCLEKAGSVVLAIEPEPGMFIETTDQAIRLIDMFDSPQFRLNLDIGHVRCCESDLIDSIVKAIPYTRHIHIEDIKGSKHYHEIPGEGDLDFQSIFKILKDFDYRHYLSVELYHHADVWERALYQSRRHLLEKMRS